MLRCSLLSQNVFGRHHHSRIDKSALFWLHQHVQAKRKGSPSQADYQRVPSGLQKPRRTDLETTPLFCLSYTDVLMKQRRCFKEVPAKHQRGGGKRVDCRRLFKRDIFCWLVRKNFFPRWGAKFSSWGNKKIVFSEKHLTPNIKLL